MRLVYHEINGLSILCPYFLRNLNAPVFRFVAGLSVPSLEGGLNDGALRSHAKTAKRLVALGLVLLTQELGGLGESNSGI
jgi:hypothetical protein